MSKLKLFIRKIYAYKFFSALVFLYPVMALMFKENNVSEVGIAVLFAVWSVFVILFQPIVGVLGDMFSRKNVLMWCQFAKLVCFAVFIMSSGFWGYVIGLAFWGLQWAAEASVAEAFVYDELVEYGAKDQYKSVSGKMVSMQGAGLLVSGVGSWIAASLGYNFVLVMSILSMVVAILCLFSIKMIQPESHHVNSKKNKGQIRFLKHVRTGLKSIFQIRYLFTAVIAFSAVTAVAQMDDFLGLLGTEIGISLAWIGTLFMVACLGEIIGGMVVKYFNHTKVKSLSLYVSIFGLIFMCFALADVRLIWGFIFVGYFWYAITRTLLFARIQDTIPSHQRTVVISLADIINQIVQIVFYALLTVGAVLSGYRLGYVICGAIVVVIGVFATIFQGHFVRRPRIAKPAR